MLEKVLLFSSILILALVGLCEHGLLRSCVLLNALVKPRLDLQAFQRQNGLKNVCYHCLYQGKAAEV